MKFILAEFSIYIITFLKYNSYFTSIFLEINSNLGYQFLLNNPTLLSFNFLHNSLCHSYPSLSGIYCMPSLAPSEMS